jgi:hypothetical protein
MTRRTPARTAALLTTLLVLAAAGADEEGFVPLFNGRDLDNFIQRGGKASYSIEDGAIVGRSVPKTENSFLCTRRDYADFILELEFKVDNELNSGVQIRSQCFDEPKTIEIQGKKKTIPAGRVHGYQVEIDPSDRAYSGAIYDEARRGVFLADLAQNQPARNAFKRGDWNHFRIECRGDSIKTWINGVPAVDLRDSMTPAGFIALQVHGVGNRAEPLEVRWRNLKIKELK